MHKGYLQSSLDELLLRAQWIMGAGCIFCVYFSYLDYVLYPDEFKTFFIIRLFWALSFLIGFILISVTRLKNYVTYILDILWILSGAIVAYLMYATDGYKSIHMAGLLLVFQAAFLANPIIISHHVVYGVIVLFMYNLSVAFHNPQIHWNNFLVANFFPLGAFSLTLIMCRVSYHHGLKNYQNQLILQKTTEELATLHKKMERMYHEASEEAKTDPLSGCFNRRHFERILDRKIRSIQGTTASFFLTMMDLDHFKEINDAFGHAEGDLAIQTVAEAILTQLGDKGVACRYGGDEFALMIEANHWEDCKAMIQEIVKKIKQLGLERCQKGVDLDISIGVTKTIGLAKSLSLDNIFHQADTALLTVKKTARGSIILYEGL